MGERKVWTSMQIIFSFFLVPRESIPLHGRTYSGKVDTSGSSKRVFNEATLLMKTFALLLKWLKAEMHFSNGQTFKVNFWMKNSHFLDQKFGERKRVYLKYIYAFTSKMYSEIWYQDSEPVASLLYWITFNYWKGLLNAPRLSNIFCEPFVPLSVVLSPTELYSKW